MFINSQILDAALRARPLFLGGMTVAEALSAFLSCRGRLRPFETQADWTAIAFANQVALRQLP
jgi:hypothetical protein